MTNPFRKIAAFDKALFDASNFGNELALCVLCVLGGFSKERAQGDCKSDPQGRVGSNRL